MEGLAVMGFVLGGIGVISISSTRKTYKNPEEKGNSRRGLQGRLKHQTNLLNSYILTHT